MEKPRRPIPDPAIITPRRVNSPQKPDYCHMGVLANWDRYIQLQGWSMLAAPAPASGKDRNGGAP